MDLQTIITYLKEQTVANQFLGAGLTLGIFWFIVNQLKTIPGYIYNFLDRRLTTVVLLNKLADSEIFDFFNGWTNTLDVVKKSGRLIPYVKWWSINGETRPRIIYSLGLGTHFFFYNKILIKLNRSRKEGKDGFSSINNEDIEIKFYTRNRKFIRELFDLVLANWENDHRGRVKIYRNSHGGSWSLLFSKERRDLSTVILRSGVLEEIKESVTRFFESKDFYKRTAIPYKNGILFYGPPGNGKSSTIFALASYFKANIYFLDLNSILDNSILIELLANIPEKSFVLIEDIDCAGITKTRSSIQEPKLMSVGREIVLNNENKKTEALGITLSGLLNTLDGITSSEGMVVFMTTNHLEKVDSALFRPGRIDQKFYIGNADTDQTARMFNKFYPNTNHNSDTDFANKINNDTVSMASIQGYLLKYRNKPDDAISRIEELINE